MAQEDDNLDNEAPEQQNALAMSDEDIMNMTEPPGSEAAEGGSDENNEGENDELVYDDDGSEQQPSAEGGSSSEGPGGQGSSSEASGDSTDDDPNNLTGAEDGLQEEGREASAEEVKKEPKDPNYDPERDGEPSQEDYKAELAKLFMPFKANGRQMQIHSVNDAISLMQMGANYNKKMAGLKPNLKLMKMLEKNELLDEGKLSFLIDLQRKDPAAVAKFMQDGEIDPVDIDVDEGDEYEPNAYTVDDKEVELDAVLEDIQDTPSFKDTIDIISNKWDGQSKQVLLDNPKLISVINDHVNSGIYGQIHEIVENEQAIGRLQGMSDIEAYKYVGDVIEANGGFAPQQIPPPANRQQQPPANKPASDPKLKSRKRAAAATKASPGGAPAEYNPLAMSDEEFEKIAAQYM